jgi:predicted nucleic acid-binding protein
LILTLCSASLKGDRLAWQRFTQYGGNLHLSSITVGELFMWVLRATASPKRLQALLDLLTEVTGLDGTLDKSRKCGELCALFLDAGQGTPDINLLIVACRQSRLGLERALCRAVLLPRKSIDESAQVTSCCLFASFLLLFLLLVSPPTTAGT